jgi:hypothetical protein
LDRRVVYEMLVIVIFSMNQNKKICIIQNVMRYLSAITDNGFIPHWNFANVFD